MGIMKGTRSKKLLFTPGPPPVLRGGVYALEGAFGRGDPTYDHQRATVLDWLRGLTGKREVVELQGAGSMAIEIMIRNFLFGRVLVVHTGHYAQRMREMCDAVSKSPGAQISFIETVNYEDISAVQRQFDWVVGVFVETSVATKQDIGRLRLLADRTGAKLALDAVASIGLEAQHELADVLAFSSCKGLLGITGAGFIAFDSEPNNSVDSFTMSLESHAERKMTGPYAQIQYLYGILPQHSDHTLAVTSNKSAAVKRFRGFLANPPDREPNLCTRLTCQVKTSNLNSVLYSPRSGGSGAIINHLGEVALGTRARGKILGVLDLATQT